MEAASGRGKKRGHVLFLPWPSQGHINPMLQFAKRVASHGPLVTLVMTRFLLNSAQASAAAAPIPMRLAAISDGCDKGGRKETPDIHAYIDRFLRAGSETLEALIRSEAEAGHPVDALVLDPFLPWAADVGRRLGVATAAFLTQSCAADTVYFHVFEGRVKWPVREAVELPGLPRLEPRDLPSFLQPSINYVSFGELLKNQFVNWEKLDEILINSFHDLETKEADYMAATCGAKTVGPTVPSAYLDKRLPSDSRYGFQLYDPVVAPCMNWLDARPPASVVYASFGSVVEMSAEQMTEAAHGLSNSGRSFLWAVRPSETHKLPEDFGSAAAAAESGSAVAGGRGLVVSWCPQLDVLAHEAVGCFLSHCGWNSTLEALSLGVPMIGVPQWSDQTMNARYVEEEWGVGVRARKDKERGVVRREEVERCVREVMDGERREGYRKKAEKYGELAKAAMEDGGSSDKNIAEFVAKYCSKGSH